MLSMLNWQNLLTSLLVFVFLLNEPFLLNWFGKKTVNAVVYLVIFCCCFHIIVKLDLVLASMGKKHRQPSGYYSRVFHFTYCESYEIALKGMRFELMSYKKSSQTNVCVLPKCSGHLRPTINVLIYVFYAYSDTFLVSHFYLYKCKIIIINVATFKLYLCSAYHNNNDR